MALRHLGITVESQGRVIDRLEMRSSKGYLAGVVDAGKLSKSLGIGAVTVGRGDLLEYLAAQLDSDTIRFDAPCAAVDESPDQARAILRNGEAASADLVVGADGQRSVVRGRFASPRLPTPTGWASLQGLTKVPLPVADGTTSIYAAGKEGGSGPDAAGRGLLQWWFDVRWPQPDPPHSVLAWLRRRFEHWGPPVSELLEVISDDQIEPFAHAWHQVPRHLTTRRVVLIGDAVHAIPPSSPRGPTSPSRIVDTEPGVEREERLLRSAQALRKATPPPGVVCLGVHVSRCSRSTAGPQSAEPVAL